MAEMDDVHRCQLAFQIVQYLMAGRYLVGEVGVLELAFACNSALHCVFPFSSTFCIHPAQCV